MLMPNPYKSDGSEISEVLSAIDALDKKLKRL